MKRLSKRVDRQIAAYQQELIKTHYAEVDNMYHQMRLWRHDYRNHIQTMKAYAMRTKGVINASCEFDVETLQPTYKLLIGIPGKSNAFAISRKLGLSEEILKEASDLVGKSDKDFEDVLSGRYR